MVFWSLGLWSLGPALAQQATVIVVAGAPGEAEFAPDLALQTEAWAKVSAQAGARQRGLMLMHMLSEDDLDLRRGAPVKKLELAGGKSYSGNAALHETFVTVRRANL